MLARPTLALLGAIALLGLQPAQAVGFIGEAETVDNAQSVALQAVALDGSDSDDGSSDDLTSPSFARQLASYAVRMVQSDAAPDISRQIGVKSSFGAHSA